MVSSILALDSCEFFSYRTLDGNVWDGFEEPFNLLRKASVGLFSYSESTSHDGFLLFGDQCTDYEEWTEAGQHILFHVAQWCSIFAPVAGFLAWFQLVCESLFCRLRGSYFFIIAFFVFAAILQGCTFLVFADTQFCFDAASQNQCALKTGAWYSIGAMAGYLLSAIVSTANKSKDGKSTKCRGCCIMTRGPDSLIFDEENQKGSETSDDGLWQTDDENEDDASAVNWAVAENTVGSNRSGGSNRSNQSNQSSSERRIELLSDTSGAEIDDLDMKLDATTQDSGKLLDPYVEEESKANNSITRETPSQDSSVRDRRTDYFDTMCCGDPLEVEKHLVQKSPSKSGKKERKSESRTSKSESRTSHQQSGNDGILCGIPVV
jgi:hypothetical protein